MKFQYNPLSAEPLGAAPVDNNITFDLPDKRIYVKGVEFIGTDTTYSVFARPTSSTNLGKVGLVPVPSYQENVNRFLREDGTWQLTKYRPITVGNETILDEDNHVALTLTGISPVVVAKSEQNIGTVTIGVPNATTTSAGLLSAADKVKLDSLSMGDGGSGGGGNGEIILATAFTTINVDSDSAVAETGKQSITFAGNNGIDVNLDKQFDYTVTINGVAMTGATETANGSMGMVPAPSKNNRTAFLRGDGTWQNVLTEIGELTTQNITSLTGYVKGTSSEDLLVTDTLNVALGKLENKADLGKIAYDWYQSIVGPDNDEYINKWTEIVSFLDSVKESETDILDTFVTRKTNQSIEGSKTFTGGMLIDCALNINGTNPITWNDGTYQQRIQTIDDSTANTEVFKFQQSANTGSSWTDLFTIYDNGQVVANKFVTIGGSSTQFVKGDGSLDNTTYLTADSLSVLTDYVTLTTAQTISGAKIFSAATIINNTLAVNNNLTVKGNILPQTSDTYSLGSSSNVWQNIYATVGTFSGSVSANTGVFTSTTTASGFIKEGSNDNNILLGAGGHKPISDFLLKSEELTNNVITKTIPLNVTSNWIDTGIDGDDLETGTYIVQVSCAANNDNLGYDCYWSGIMSWWKGRTNDDDSDEIILHRSGRAYSNTIYLRTIMRSDTDTNGLKLQIAANKDIGAQYTYTFKFKRVI